MKFDVIFGLAAALALAPNVVAWNLPGFGNGHGATPTAQPPSGAGLTGTLPSGPPSFPEPSGHLHGHGGRQSGQPGPHPSGTIPSGAPSGLPSGKFGGFGGGPIPSGVPSGLPTGEPQPGGGFGGFGQGGQPSLANVPASGPTPSAGAIQGQGDEQFERIHARQIRPIQV